MQTVATIGFNVEMITYNRVSFTVFDIGGQEKIRTLWKHYFSNIDALIFVVDSSDRDRMPEAKYELHRILSDMQLQSIQVLVFGNKQDMRNPMQGPELVRALDLQSIRQNWFLQPYVHHIYSNSYTSCCGVTGTGLYEGLDWLSRAL